MLLINLTLHLDINSTFCTKFIQKPIMSSQYIVYGSEDTSGVPEIPLGQLLLNALISRDKDEALIIHGVSGNVLSNGDLVVNTLKCVTAFKREGLKKGDVIAIISENSLWFSIPLLAGFYLGVVVNPLNPAYTTGEICRMLNLSKPKIVFCSGNALHTIKGLLKSLDFIEKVVILSDENFEGFQNILEFMEGTLGLVNAFELEDINIETDGALILSTSGTSGLPKGALLTHRNARTGLTFLREPFGTYSPDDVLLLVLPLFHSAALGTFLTSFYYGFKIILLEKFHPRMFLESIEKYKVTLLLLVPTLVNFLAKSDLALDYNLTSVKEIFCGGSALHKANEDALAKRLVNTQGIRQMYGCTEFNGSCSAQPKINRNPHSCGTLLPGYSAKICSLVDGKTIHPEEMGEIRIKGPGLMKQYIQNPEETKASFDEDGFFKTGDIGYFDKDGNLFVVDRAKEIIKYKGFQVAPAEIESVLLSHPFVKEAAVVGIPDEKAGELPAAFVVLKEQGSVTEKDICDFVAKRLSIQKRLHGGVIFVDELPKNQTGKVLRRVLRDKLGGNKNHNNTG